MTIPVRSAVPIGFHDVPPDADERILQISTASPCILLGAAVVDADLTGRSLDLRLRCTVRWLVLACCAEAQSPIAAFTQRIGQTSRFSSEGEHMPPMTVEPPLHSRDSAGIEGTALALLAALACAPREPDERVNGWDDSRQRAHDRIEKAVLHICNSDNLDGTSRWEKREIFVSPAAVSFLRRRLIPSGDTSEGEYNAAEVRLEVVTTDLSANGAGILCYSYNEPLPARVTLIIDDTAFDCEVRWTTKIGQRVYRYGLSFSDVNTSPAICP